MTSSDASVDDVATYGWVCPFEWVLFFNIKYMFCVGKVWSLVGNGTHKNSWLCGWGNWISRSEMLFSSMSIRCVLFDSSFSCNQKNQTQDPGSLVLVNFKYIYGNF